MLADQVATEAHNQLSKPMVEQFHRVRQAHQEALSLLTRQISLRQAMADLRVKLLQTVRPTDNPQTNSEALYTHTAPGGWQYHPRPDEQEAVYASKYGPHHSYALLRWLETLLWPQQDHVGTHLPAGITWLELAVNFMVMTQRNLPVNTGTNKDPCFMCPEEHPALDIQAYTFETQVSAFRHSVEHIEYLVGQHVLPTARRQRVRSLQLLYGGPIKNGVPLRPQMRCQHQTLDTVKQYGQQLMDPAEFTEHVRPVIPVVEPISVQALTLPADDARQARASRYHQRRKQLRNTRGCQDGEGA